MALRLHQLKGRKSYSNPSISQCSLLFQGKVILIRNLAQTVSKAEKSIFSNINNSKSLPYHTYFACYKTVLHFGPDQFGTPSNPSASAFKHWDSECEPSLSQSTRDTYNSLKQESKLSLASTGATGRAR